MKELKEINSDYVLWFDIETAPLTADLLNDSNLFDVWDYIKNKKDTLTDIELSESYFSECSLRPEISKVISICAGVIRGDSISIKTYDFNSEYDILNAFNSDVSKFIEAVPKLLLGGYFISKFDIPFIYKRMLIHNITPNDIFDNKDDKPWIKNDADLWKYWKGNSIDHTPLVALCYALNVPSPKGSISGKDVGSVYWNEGLSGLKRISEYCAKDVVAVANVFRVLRGEPLLSETTEAPETVEIPLLKKLMDGGTYGKKEKDELLEVLKKLNIKQREIAFNILNAIPSAAKGKVTKFKKSHITELKKLL